VGLNTKQVNPAVNNYNTHRGINLLTPMNELVIDYANLPTEHKQDELSTFVKEVE